jgi:diguanylate cyclase (GGDEF)-like protein
MSESLIAAAAPPGELSVVDGTGEVCHSRDPLTGVSSWKAFHTALRAAAMEATHDQRPLALLILDLDRFVAVNDRVGPTVGDRLLKGVADLLCETCPAPAAAARYGDDQFIVILPAMRVADAVVIGDRLRVALASRDLGAGAPTDGMTASIGVALYRDGEPLCHFVQRAADALAEAKDAGCDRVVTEGAGVRHERG